MTPHIFVAAGIVAIAVAGIVEQTREIAPRRTGTAAIAGRVVRTDSALTSAVGRIVVTLDEGDGRSKRQTVSDDEGRFLFDRLAPGRYGLMASKVGWVTSYYGSPRPGHPPGVRVAVADGARAVVDIPIVKGAVIAGRILNDDGRPMGRQFPWLLQERVIGDRKMLARLPEMSVGSFERAANDLGEFRFFGLTPGTYYIVVNPSIAAGARVTTDDEVRWAFSPPGQSAAPAQGRIAGYTSTFYPGTTDPSNAQGIVVGPGEVRDGLEFRVSFVPVVRVEGNVQRPDGTPAANVSVTLADREPRVNLEGATRLARTDASGAFFFQNLPPGDYRVTVRATSSGAPTPPPSGTAGVAPLLDFWGQLDLLLSGQDVRNLAITLAPASTISGRLAFAGAGTAPPADLSAVRLQFIPVAALATSISRPGGGAPLGHQATVNADGTFRAPGLPPGRYVPSASWPGMRTGDGMTGWWLTSITIGGRDIGDRPIDVDVQRDVANVTLGFDDRIGSIDGSLTDSTGAAAAAYFVLAFPVERESWTTTSRRTMSPVQTGTDGRYRMVGLLPGDYYLAVVSELGREDAADPQFLESIVGGALRVTIRSGEARRYDLKIK